MNRATVIERLYMIQDRLTSLRRGMAMLGATHHPDRDATLQNIIYLEVRPLDGELATLIGWLAGYATHAGFPSDIAAMCKELLITSEVLGEIERGEFPRPITDPEALAKELYRHVKGTLQTVLKEKLAKAEAVIIRTVDAPLIDELARNVAQSVIGVIELQVNREES